ncbi:hypothetical protein MSUIS_01820 [Mycoplasma suis KI3806]|nr:hypothetical protein [Mycoplasma suis]CBZ40275.1 hypothetical protein MSUIS_01820 [Mycoplasma suis KI3806]
MNHQESSKIDLKSLTSLQNDVEKISVTEDQISSIFEKYEINEILSSDPTIENIFSEITKNKETKEIEEESSQTLDKVKQILVNHTQDFERAQKIIEQWSKKQSSSQEASKSSKSRRSAEQESSKTLSVQERKALFCFYKKFSELRKQQRGYSNRLKNVEGKEVFEEAQFQALSSKMDIVSALEKIGWNDSDMSNFGKYLRKEINIEGEDPLSVLLDISFLEKTRGEAISWKGKIEQFIEGQRQSCRGTWGPWRCRDISSSLNILQSSASSIEEDAIMKIANRLMEEMIKNS